MTVTPPDDNGPVAARSFTGAGPTARHWWACAAPERPADRWIMWHMPCRGCAVKARAELAHGVLNPTEHDILAIIAEGA